MGRKRVVSKIIEIKNDFEKALTHMNSKIVKDKFSAFDNVSRIFDSICLQELEFILRNDGYSDELIYKLLLDISENDDNILKYLKTAQGRDALIFIGKYFTGELLVEYLEYCLGDDSRDKYDENDGLSCVRSPHKFICCRYENIIHECNEALAKYENKNIQDRFLDAVLEEYETTQQNYKSLYVLQEK